ncbi:MAG: ComF family protein, partial [Agathobaculum sp.]|uniref:ComF family protein n=1 Tax=Agathobaculum sp. TaxID=2048138 RepID=UPI003D94D760
MGVVFTKKCVLCGANLSSFEDGKSAMLCETCAAEVREKYRCSGHVRIFGAEEASAALYYTGTVKGAMQRFKFEHKKHYADWFAAQTAPLLAAHLDDWKPDLITFAPIGPLHLYQRGYNQSELIARFVARPFGIPCKPTLKKRPFSRKQSTRTNAEARRINARRSFLPLPGVDLSGKSVVFVDDIITTGSTAAAAVRLLRNMGAAKVYVLASTKV